MRFDLTDSRFGKLVVLGYSGRKRDGNYLWNCKCDCGKTKLVATCNLRGGTKSCGCLAAEVAVKSAHARRGQTKGDGRQGWFWKVWREAVLTRDNKTCQGPGPHGGLLQVHHIKAFNDFVHLRFEVSNGITLCRRCHTREENEIWLEKVFSAGFNSALELMKGMTTNEIEKKKEDDYKKFRKKTPVRVSIPKEATLTNRA